MAGAVPREQGNRREEAQQQIEALGQPGCSSPASRYAEPVQLQECPGRLPSEDASPTRPTKGDHGHRP